MQQSGKVAGRSFPWNSHLRGRKVNSAERRVAAPAADVAAIDLFWGERSAKNDSARRYYNSTQCHGPRFHSRKKRSFFRRGNPRRFLTLRREQADEVHLKAIDSTWPRLSRRCCLGARSLPKLDFCGPWLDFC